MAIAQAPAPESSRNERLRLGPLALAALSGIGIAFAVALTLMVGSHAWLFDSAGHPVVTDFVSFWSAGKLVLNGHALAAYNPHLRHAAEIAAVGHAFPDAWGWWYPPLFLFVAAALASLPYAAAFNVMNNVTLVLHAATTAAIARRRAAFFLAAAMPWGMFGMIHGQNQFLTAAVVGIVLLTLETRPAFSGLVLGLLSYKPQLGVLFPVALAFGGYWRAFGWACAGTVFWTALSGAVFGFATLPAFWHGLSAVGGEVMVTNPAYLANLQSLYGQLRSLGIGAPVSWVAQAGLSATCLVAVAAVWRRSVPFDLKAAALATAIPLASPYIQGYDLTLLTVALAFLYRHRAFSTREWFATTLAVLSFGFYFWTTAHPAALVACGAVSAMIFARLSFAGGLLEAEPGREIPDFSPSARSQQDPRPGMATP
ncbi:MAG: glycosyltransferase family 87 protein [Rhizomicrobium sp.]